MDKVELRIAPATVARAVLVILVLWGIGWLLWTGRQIVFVLFFGTLVGIFLSFFAEHLQRVGLPRVVAVLLVLTTALILAVGFMLGIWPVVRDQLGLVAQELPDALGRITAWFEEQYRGITERVGGAGGEIEREVRDTAAQELSRVVAGAMPVLNSAVGALAGTLVVLMAGVYMAVDPKTYRRGFEHLLPPAVRERVGVALDRTSHTLRWWMIGTAINMVAVGVLTTVGLLVLDVPAALALGAIAGLFEFIPIIGPILASLPAIAVALAVSPTKALWVVLLYIVLQQIESNLITPLVMRGTVHLPPALTLLFQSFMALIFGFLGLLLAVPILAVLMVGVRALYVEPLEERAGRA